MEAEVDFADTIVFTAGAGGGGQQATTAIDGDGVVKAIEAAHLAGVTRFALVSVGRDLVLVAVGGDDADVPEPFFAYGWATRASTECVHPLEPRSYGVGREGADTCPDHVGGSAQVSGDLTIAVGRRRRRREPRREQIWRGDV